MLLEKGDIVWVVSYRGMHEATVSRVYPRKAIVKSRDHEWTFDRDSDRSIWQAPFANYSRPDHKAYKNKALAESDYKIRKLEASRYYISKFVENREMCKLEAVAEMLEVMNKYATTKL